MSMLGKWLLLSKMGDSSESHKYSKEEYDVCPQARYWEHQGYHTYMSKYGKHFSHPMAKWAISMNEWNNGKGKGEYWTCEQTETALKSMGLTLTTHNKYDAYYLANTKYADHSSATFTDTMILQLVCDIMLDKDGYDGMPFDMWLAKAMGLCWSIDWGKMI